jgi:hypothetical protein
MGATVRTSLSYQLVSRERGDIKREEEACEGGELCPSFLAHCRRLLHPGEKKEEQLITSERDREEEQGRPGAATLVPRGARRFLLHLGAEKRKSSSPRECTGPR